MLILLSFLFYYYCKSGYSESPTEQEQPSGTAVVQESQYRATMAGFVKQYPRNYNVVGMMCPAGLDRINWSAKIGPKFQISLVYAFIGCP